MWDGLESKFVCRSVEYNDFTGDFLLSGYMGQHHTMLILLLVPGHGNLGHVQDRIPFWGRRIDQEGRQLVLTLDSTHLRRVPVVKHSRKHGSAQISLVFPFRVLVA